MYTETLKSNITVPSYHIYNMIKDISGYLISNSFSDMSNLDFCTMIDYFSWNMRLNNQGDLIFYSKDHDCDDFDFDFLSIIAKYAVESSYAVTIDDNANIYKWTIKKSKLKKRKLKNYKYIAYTDLDLDFEKDLSSAASSALLL